MQSFIFVKIVTLNALYVQDHKNLNVPNVLQVITSKYLLVEHVLLVNLVINCQDHAKCAIYLVDLVSMRLQLAPHAFLDFSCLFNNVSLHVRILINLTQ
jgi:hypothetical protein